MEKNKSAFDIVEGLEDSLNSMYENDILNESVLTEIDELVSIMYDESNRLCNKENGQFDPNDKEYSPSNRGYMIFPYVSEEHQMQFAQDYGCIIDMVINSGGYIADYDEAVKKITLMRE